MMNRRKRQSVIAFISLTTCLMSVNVLQAAAPYAKVSKQDGQFVCEGRRKSGEVFKETHAILMDAVNRACRLAGEGTEAMPAKIDILTSGDSGKIKRRSDGGKMRFGISPLSFQTLDFHGHVYHVEAGGKTSKFMTGIFLGFESGNGERPNPRRHVTIRNVRMTGNPRGAINIWHCDNIILENIDIDINSEIGGGINIRRGKHIEIKGEIMIRGGHGHGIDIVSCSHVSIGDVTATHTTKGCGVLLSTNHDVRIGHVFGYKNDPRGSYATLRFANGNANSQAAGVYSRNCGKGIMVTSGEAGWMNRDKLSGWQTPGNHNNTVYKADILRSWGPNIYMRTPSSNNSVTHAVIREDMKAANRAKGKLLAITGEKNQVGINVLPKTEYASGIKTIRINELSFGFNDCSPFENFELNGTDKYIRDRTCDGYGYARAEKRKGSGMSWNMLGARGLHQLKWRYASSKKLETSLYINGQKIRDISFPATASEKAWEMMSIKLDHVERGRKFIEIVATSEAGLPLVDYLEITGPGAQVSLFDMKKGAIAPIDQAEASTDTLR